jgi:hypothetical protein
MPQPEISGLARATLFRLARRCVRDHPDMSYRGVRNWPPMWMLKRDHSVRALMGEAGVLTFVRSNSRMSKCFLFIDFEEELYIGTLIFNDRTFCRQISNLLCEHIGRPIKEIGDVNVSHLL